MRSTGTVATGASAGPKTRSGAESLRMCSSSRVPALGLIGTIGTPAASAPTTATTVSNDFVAHTATREAPDTPRGHRPRRRAQLRVGQRVFTDPDRLAAGRLLQTCQEHTEVLPGANSRATCRSLGATMPGTTAPRALVVDDAPENRMLVSALLMQQGFEVAQAEPTGRPPSRRPP